jgi:glycosyltransferase involved in cell wall biosynthesis
MPHGMLDPYSLSVKRWRKALYLWALERRNLLAARRLIYTTPEEARLAAIRSFPLPKGDVIPLGGDAPARNSASLASTFLERFPQARGRRQLLFLGRLDFKKGLDRILIVLPSVLRAFPQVLLTIVGDGAPAFEAAVKREIARQGLIGSVLMTGRLDAAAKWGAYASADLFLLPSRQENFAITVAEAMHAGIPVIITTKVNTWPYVREASAGIVLEEPGVEAALRDGILSLLANRETAKLMGKRGQEYAGKYLTWSGAADRLLKCYEDVLTGTQLRH